MAVDHRPVALRHLFRPADYDLVLNRRVSRHGDIHLPQRELHQPVRRLPRGGDHRPRPEAAPIADGGGAAARQQLRRSGHDPIHRLRQQVHGHRRDVLARYGRRHELARGGRRGQTGRLDAGQGDHRLGQPDHRRRLQGDRRQACRGVLQRHHPEPRKEPEVMSRVQLVAVLVSLAGVGVSIYLTILHYAGAVPGCPVTGTINCEAVLSSPYALIAGLPVPTSAAGIAWFGVSAVLWTRQLHWMHPVWAAVALETPVDPLSDYYLDSVHMLQHVLLAFVAPPLLLLGLSPGMVARLVRVPGVRAITEPIPSQVIAGVVMVVWHLPPIYDATLRNEGLHVLVHLTFIAAASALYWPIVDATSAHAHWQMSPGAKLVYMLLATLPQDGVALALIFSRVPFYEYYTHAPRLIAGFTALIDQTIAGAVLMVAGKITLAVAAMVIFFRWFGAEHRADRAPALTN